MTNKSKVIINFEKGIIRIVQGKNNAFSLDISKYDKTLMRFLIFFSEFCLEASYLIFKYKRRIGNLHFIYICKSRYLLFLLFRYLKEDLF